MTRRCQCWDSGCYAQHPSRCREQTTTELRRVDMGLDDRVSFCAECAEDALGSGMFADVEEADEGDEEDGPDPVSLAEQRLEQDQAYWAETGRTHKSRAR